MKSIFCQDSLTELHKIAGLELYSCCSGMRYKKDDIFVAHMVSGASVAGVFTKNDFVGEPVKWCRSILGKMAAKVLIVNSGYSNVLCGKKGEETIKATLKAVNDRFGTKDEEVYICSTGIIGQAVKDDYLVTAVKEKLAACSFEQATIAINTTDTFNKMACAKAIIDGQEVSISGIVKGSGMIEPNMATMLGFVFTDANISTHVLQQMLEQVTDETYNSITVDSDTSTSDTVLAFATNQVSHKQIIDINDSRLDDFKEKFFQVNLQLAKLVVKDGEGISNFFEVEIINAPSAEAGKIIAKSVANSPLVKTAIAGKDANWGRILMAVGKVAQNVDVNNVQVKIGDIIVCQDGGLYEGYKEAEASKYLKENNEIKITVNFNPSMNSGDSRYNVTKVYASDLTKRYIEINADYRS